MRVCECRRISQSVRMRVRTGPCALPRVYARVCGSAHADVWGSCACLRACLYAHLCGRPGPCVRTHAYARVCLFRRAFVCACERVLPFHREASSRMCVCARRCLEVCVCARMPRRCAGAVEARPGWRHGRDRRYNISAGGAGRLRMRVRGLVRSAGFLRVGRRCHLDVPHPQGGMGWPNWAHVRG